MYYALRIGSRAAFARFLADPARAALAPERDAAIRKTEAHLSDALVDYPA